MSHAHHLLLSANVMQFTTFAPLANIDNYDANVQIYDTAKCVEIYCFCS